MQINAAAILFCFTLLCGQVSVAAEQVQNDKSTLSASGYLETYFLHDTNRPASEQRPSFAYSHTETDQASINLGFIKLKLDAENVRGNLALGSGTYMRANYAAEPQALQKVLEANVGIKLANHLWLDAGVMPSHIGFESAVGLDNWTLSRSILADN